MRLLKILLMVVMVMGFNPIQDGDWQGLNIALERLFFTNAEAKTVKQAAKKTGSVSARKTVTITNDSSREIADGSLAKPVVSVVDDGQSAALYVDGGSDENVTIPDTGVVYKTQAKITIPSSYYLDLRGNYVSASTQRYTADLLTLHNTDGNTITLTTIDETNDINDVQTASVAGKRDQAAAFTGPVWLYFFIIYNSITGDVSSLSSLSATAPTLPVGYTYFMRVGSVYLPGSGNLSVNSQINDQIYTDIAFGLIFEDSGPVSAGDLESVDISAYVPPTAKAVTGMLGGTVADATIRGVKVSSDSAGTKSLLSATIKAENRVAGYGPGSSLSFTIPIITAQTIWWTASSTGSIYGMYITAYQDDL